MSFLKDVLTNYEAVVNFLRLGIKSCAIRKIEGENEHVFSPSTHLLCVVLAMPHLFLPETYLNLDIDDQTMMRPKKKEEN